MSLIADRYHPTVAMLPIGGHFTMDPEGAALAAKLLKVKTVIPMHYGTFPALKGTPDELRAALKKQKSNVKVVEVKPGDTTTL
jgi:L-ascorbate metabolism protein UlaG (beta-lactamase superfamily)